MGAGCGVAEWGWGEYSWCGLTRADTSSRAHSEGRFSKARSPPRVCASLPETWHGELPCGGSQARLPAMPINGQHIISLPGARIWTHTRQTNYFRCIMIKQIKFVSVPVSDQNRALDFYTEQPTRREAALDRAASAEGGDAYSSSAFHRRRR